MSTVSQISPQTQITPRMVPAPNGYIVVQQLPDGRVLVESYWLNLAPFDGGSPRSELVGDDVVDAAGVDELVAALTDDLATTFAAEGGAA